MSTASTPPRALLLLGQADPRQFHNHPAHWAALASLLRGTDLAARVITDDLSDLTPANLARFDVILNQSSGLIATDAQLDALLDAVAGGIGYVGLHGATTTFPDSPAYHAMIGSRFDHHPPLREYTIDRLDPDHPVTAGLAPFTLEDELYHLKEVADDITIIAQAEGLPMVYTRQHGAGRICYIAPGHDQRAITRPEYAQLVSQAVAWAARRPTA